MGLSFSAFLFRDILRYILPTIIASFLFIPLFVPQGTELSIPAIIVASIALGYVIFALVSWISKRFDLPPKYVPVTMLD